MRCNTRPRLGCIWKPSHPRGRAPEGLRQHGALRALTLHERSLFKGWFFTAQGLSGTTQRFWEGGVTLRSSDLREGEHYCVIPFLLPPRENPCPARAQKA